MPNRPRGLGIGNGSIIALASLWPIVSALLQVAAPLSDMFQSLIQQDGTDSAQANQTLEAQVFDSSCEER